MCVCVFQNCLGLTFLLMSTSSRGYSKSISLPLLPGELQYHKLHNTGQLLLIMSKPCMWERIHSAVWHSTMCVGVCILMCSDSVV